jgi:hypothetical protein
MSFHVHQHILFIGFIKVYLVMLVTKKNGVIDLIPEGSIIHFHALFVMVKL